MSTKIEWTQETWNPVIGCTPVSEGCRNCYAARDALRMAGNPHPRIGPVYEGLATKAGDGRPVFTGRVMMLGRRLRQPLRWRKPRMAFVNSMGDLLHPEVHDWFVDEVYDVMCRSSQHTFQILTKRPERMSAFFGAREPDGALIRPPLPNVWLGTSIEDQATADERIPHLLQTPAAVRFISYEPALGPVDLSRYLLAPHLEGHMACAGVHWVIAGGESGPRARPCNIQWLRDVVRQCKAAGVPCFVKQLGAHVLDRNDAGFDADWNDSDGWPDAVDKVEWLPMSDQYQGALVRVRTRSRKGSDLDEWPEDLRVREWPSLGLQEVPDEA